MLSASVRRKVPLLPDLPGSQHAQTLPSSPDVSHGSHVKVKSPGTGDVNINTAVFLGQRTASASCIENID